MTTRRPGLAASVPTRHNAHPLTEGPGAPPPNPGQFPELRLGRAGIGSQSCGMSMATGLVGGGRDTTRHHPGPELSSIRKQLTQVGSVPWRTLPSRRPSGTGRSPAGAEVAVCVGEGGTVLAEVAVEG